MIVNADDDDDDDDDDDNADDDADDDDESWWMRIFNASMQPCDCFCHPLWRRTYWIRHRHDTEDDRGQPIPGERRSWIRFVQQSIETPLI